MDKIRGLYKNSHGSYQWRPSSKGLPEGVPEPKPIQLRTKDRDEAIRMVFELRKAMPGPEKDGYRTLSQWAELYLAEREEIGGHRRITSTQVRASLVMLGEYFGRRDVRLITDSEVLAWYSSIKSPTRSPATTHKHFRQARALFFWLLQRKVIASNPFSKLHLPVPKQSKRDEFCTPEQRDAIIDACDREDLRFILMCGFFAGMRINEIVNARWNWFQVTGERGILTIRNERGSFRTKTGRERQIPMHARLLAYYRTLTPGRPDEFCLHPEAVQGKAWLRWDGRRPWRDLVASLDLKWVTFHTMRHTFASLHASAGTDELKIRRWLGITPETFARHYAGLMPDHAAVNAI